MAMTPRARSAAVSEASLLSAPRSLNELVTCRFSYLTKTEAPVSAESRGAGSIGVRSTCPAITPRAAWISARVTPMVPPEGPLYCCIRTYHCFPLRGGAFLSIFPHGEGAIHVHHRPRRHGAFC